MRALPIIIIVVLLAGIGYLLRNSVTGLFTGTTDKNDSQTVVLRQTATPAPTATTSPAPTPTVIPNSSIVNLNSTAAPVPVASNLPSAGPADDLVTAAVVAAGLVGSYYYFITKRVPKANIEIL